MRNQSRISKKKGPSEDGPKNPPITHPGFRHKKYPIL